MANDKTGSQKASSSFRGAPRSGKTPKAGPRPKAEARRLRNFTESVIREQTRMAHAHGAVNLAQGFPDFPCDEVIKDLARAAIDRDHNQYSMTWGMPGLRQAIAAKARSYNGITADPDRNVTVTCGATEAMASAFMSLVDPGREVILFQPFYENYNPDAFLAGAKPVYVTLREPDWSFDPKELARAFNNKTAALVLCTPHNPTGKVFTRAELEVVAALCQKWGVMVFSDEIYEHILYDGAVHVSPASVPGLEDLTVTINSASKTYGITGWRVGWAIAPERMTNSLRQVHDFMTVCAATPLQEAVRGALALPDSFYRGLAGHYRKRRDYLVGGLEALGFHCHVPKGAYYVMADVGDLLKANPGFKDEAGLARHLVQEVKVAAVPGGSFYKTLATVSRTRIRVQPKLRFCFCKKEETLALALERLSDFCRP